MSSRPAPRPRPVASAAPAAHLARSHGVPVVVVEGPEWLDIATAPGVRQVVDAALARRPERLAVDLSRCQLADAYGLGMLERARRRGLLQDTELVLTGVTPRVRRVLVLTGLDEVLPVDADLVARP